MFLEDGRACGPRGWTSRWALAPELLASGREVYFGGIFLATTETTCFSYLFQGFEILNLVKTMYLKVPIILKIANLLLHILFGVPQTIIMYLKVIINESIICE